MLDCTPMVVGKRCVGWHASRVTDRVRVTTGNTMDPDKHWLMHIHTPTLYKGDASTDQPQIQRATLMRHIMRIHAHHHHAHAHMHAGMQHTHADRYSHMHTCASHTSSSSSHPPTPTPTPRPPTHPPTQIYEHRYASSQRHRRTTPVHRLDFVHHTLAGVTGRRRQLHSARRQTTVQSARGQHLDAVTVQGIQSRTGKFIIPGLRDTGSSETVLQGPSCVSATHSHTRTWLSWVYVSKLACDALAVAGVNRRPFGLLPALLQEACDRARHTS
jgi:hypothetical protein